MHDLTVRHNFETGHRLPHRPGKCQSLHGHSMWCEVTLEGERLDGDGMLVDFGDAKARVRGWVDEHFDHGLILGKHDPLVPILGPHGKVFVMDEWPTVENIAMLLGETCVALFIGKPRVKVSRVWVQETHVNGAGWTNG